MQDITFMVIYHLTIIIPVPVNCAGPLRLGAAHPKSPDSNKREHLENATESLIKDFQDWVSARAPHFSSLKQMKMYKRTFGKYK